MRIGFYFASIVLAVILSASVSEAAESCAKASFKGDASTYNPYLPRWRTGGGTLATGGPYNPNSYDAALQLDLAKQYRCGYGRGAICHAVVQAPNGRALIVRINDNGPLVRGRIIDLNEKSMRYLTLGLQGANSGIVKNVTVTLLCSLEGQQLGPLNEQERQAWLSRTFDAPQFTGGGASPYTIGVPTTIGTPATTYDSNAGRIYSEDYYCIKSIDPVIVIPVPAGTPMPANCYNSSQATQQRPLRPPPMPPPPPPPPPQQQQQLPQQAGPSQTQIQQQTVNQPPVTNQGNILQRLIGGTPGGSAQAQVKPVAMLIAQPRIAVRGNPIVVSWSTVGMKASAPCILRSGDVALAQKNEGSTIVPGSNLARGTKTFELSCTAASGEAIQRTASVTVN